MRRRLTALFAFVAVSATAPQAARAEASLCLSNWSEARAVVKREGLVTVEQLVKLVPVKFGGDILRIALCQSDDAFTYRLVIREPSGIIRQLTVDARQPFVP